MLIISFSFATVATAVVAFAIITMTHRPRPWAEAIVEGH